MKLGILLSLILSITTSIPSYASSIQTEESWQNFIKDVHSLKKEDLIKNTSNENSSYQLNDKNSVPIDDITIVMPSYLQEGVNIAVQDLKNYLETITGKSIKIQNGTIQNNNLFFENEITTKNVIVIDSIHTLDKNIKPEEEEKFSITSRNYQISKKNVNLIRLQANNFIGLQYAIYNLMELTGKRFLYYKQEFTPNINNAKLPANNFSMSFNTPNLMKLRGFSPHLYHPIPLSVAFHNPSDKHFEMIKEYLDWLVKNKQNYVIFPMLELDKKNKYLPIRDENKPKFKEWVTFANKIVNYAHKRGIKISIKLAFANFVSANSFAIDPFKAMGQSIDLDNRWKEIKKVEKNTNSKEFKDKLEREYNELLKKYSEEDFKDIKKLVDDFMQISWDEITWHLGTSEFSPTNDDLTINWMNDTYKYIKTNYPNVDMAVRSHVPPKPFSEKYNDSYFHLIKFANSGINELIHTVQAYSLTDYAPVYGTGNFEHKLKYLFFANPERKEIYYPESSYWVTYDVDIPMFLPVYILNRKQDIDIVKKIDHLDGHATFTTAWEWGYWFNDYISAQMQVSPEKSLHELLNESFTIFGKAQTPLVELFKDVMITQQKLLLDKNLHKYMKGVSWLTDFGITLKNNPLVNTFIEGTNSTPERLKPQTLNKWSKKELDNFIQNDLQEMELLMNKFHIFSKKIKFMEDIIPEESKSFYMEFSDGLEINYLRSKEVYNSWKAVTLSRLAILDNDKELKKESKKYLSKAKNTLIEAEVLIRKREKVYYFCGCMKNNIYLIKRHQPQGIKDTNRKGWCNEKLSYK
jgi:hypothetical protein